MHQVHDLFLSKLQVSNFILTIYHDVIQLLISRQELSKIRLILNFVNGMGKIQVQ
jgi:hypothetical protein